MRVVAVLGLMTIGAFAETAVPSFEVASIRAGQPGRMAIEAVPGALTMRNVRLSACIRWAYSLQDYQLSGPGWMEEAFFDIAAKAGTPAKEPELRQMLQALLAERFKLAIHRETKELPSLILTVGKNGHKLVATEVEGTPTFKTGKLNLTGAGASVGQLVEFLSQQLRTPVIDQTGLKGKYNYFLDINAYITEEMRNSGGPAGGPPPEAPSIIAQAVQSQLGFKLDAKKSPVEMVVVDRVEKVPTEN